MEEYVRHSGTQDRHANGGRKRKRGSGKGPCQRQILFKKLEMFSKFALEQKWGVGANAGYIKTSGEGKLTKPQWFKDLRPVREAQMYMRLAYSWGLWLGFLFFLGVTNATSSKNRVL